MVALGCSASGRPHIHGLVSSFFLSILIQVLPASPTCPTWRKIIGIWALTMNSLRTGSECVIPAWVGVDQDMAALRRIVCETLHIPDSDCGSAIPVGVLECASYGRVYSFSLPGSRSIIARLVAPVKSLLKTEGEVAAMDFVRGKCHNNFVTLWSLVIRIFQKTVPLSLFQKYSRTAQKRTR